MACFRIAQVPLMSLVESPSEAHQVLQTLDKSLRSSSWPMEVAIVHDSPLAHVSVRHSWISNRPKLRASSIVYPRKTIEALRLQPFETTTCVESYLAKFEVIAGYNDWSEKDKTAQLKLALKGASAQLLWNKGTKTELIFDNLVRTLKIRFGSEGQSERYRMELISRKRGKNERIPALHGDILRLTTLAYPGQKGVINDINAMNAFLSAIDDKEFELRIRKKNHKDIGCGFSGHSFRSLWQSENGGPKQQKGTKCHGKRGVRDRDSPKENAGGK